MCCPLQVQPRLGADLIPDHQPERAAGFTGLTPHARQAEWRVGNAAEIGLVGAALHGVIVTRARCHPPTRDYIARRRSEGKSTREAIRCLKR